MVGAMTPTCPNCQAILAPHGPRGYDSPYAITCSAQTSEECPVEICTDCAAFFEVDQSADGENWTDTCTTARCFPCEYEREARARDERMAKA